MSDIFAARSQMAVSLAFHISFAAIGVALPLMMVIAEGLWLRTHDAAYLRGQTMGQGYGDPVCYRRRFRHGSVVRTRFVVAAIYGVGGGVSESV